MASMVLPNENLDLSRAASVTTRERDRSIGGEHTGCACVTRAVELRRRDNRRVGESARA